MALNGGRFSRYRPPAVDSGECVVTSSTRVYSETDTEVPRSDGAGGALYPIRSTNHHKVGAPSSMLYKWYSPVLRPAVFNHTQ